MIVYHGTQSMMMFLLHRLLTEPPRLLPGPVPDGAGPAGPTLHRSRRPHPHRHPRPHQGRVQGPLGGGQEAGWRGQWSVYWSGVSVFNKLVHAFIVAISAFCITAWFSRLIVLRGSAPSPSNRRRHLHRRRRPRRRRRGCNSRHVRAKAAAERRRERKDGGTTNWMHGEYYSQFFFDADECRMHFQTDDKEKQKISDSKQFYFSREESDMALA